MHERFGGMLTDEVVGALGYERSLLLEQHAQPGGRRSRSMPMWRCSTCAADRTAGGEGEGLLAAPARCSHNPIGEAGLAALASGVRRRLSCSSSASGTSTWPTASDAQLLSFVLHPLLEARRCVASTSPTTSSPPPPAPRSTTSARPSPPMPPSPASRCGAAASAAGGARAPSRAASRATPPSPPST